MEKEHGKHSHEHGNEHGHEHSHSHSFLGGHSHASEYNYGAEKIMAAWEGSGACRIVRQLPVRGP